MLFEAPGSEQFLSGAILDPETVYQKSSQGEPFPTLLARRGILCGVKPSLTVYTLPGTGGETVMQGLDSLAERMRGYKAAGCSFAKWRSPLTVDVAAGKPSGLAIESNCRDLARYALICQSEGVVPIVEPDVVLAGSHGLDDAVEANVRILAALVRALTEHGVYLDGIVLKTNLVNAGVQCSARYTADEIADANLCALRRTLPVSIRTVNYLSGGQSLACASARLHALNVLKRKRGGDRYAPWNLSFSWSAAVQLPLFELCRDSALARDPISNLPLDAMAVLYVKHRAIASAAAKGEHIPALGDGDHVL
jgi:fructose-bisphosphate aldolase class I